MNQYIEKLEKSAGAVVFLRENSEIFYLLLHYQESHWDFPKGHVEAGESCEKAAKREIEEETGISDIKIVDGFREDISYSFRARPEKIITAGNSAGLIAKSVVFYLAETKQKEIKISKEHSGFLWLNFEDAIKKVTFLNAKKILKKANDFLINKK